MADRGLVVTLDQTNKGHFSIESRNYGDSDLNLNLGFPKSVFFLFFAFNFSKCKSSTTCGFGKKKMDIFFVFSALHLPSSSEFAFPKKFREDWGTLGNIREY